MHGFAVHVGYPHHQGLSSKPGLLSSKRHQWVSSGLQTAGSPTSTRLGSFHRLKRYKKKTADLSRDTKKGGRVMDALVKRCECCNGPVPETKRGRPQEIARFTGHSLRDVAAILDRYLARTDKLRSTALEKLERARR